MPAKQAPKCGFQSIAEISIYYLNSYGHNALSDFTVLNFCAITDGKNNPERNIQIFFFFDFVISSYI